MWWGNCDFYWYYWGKLIFSCWRLFSLLLFECDLYFYWLRRWGYYWRWIGIGFLMIMSFCESCENVRIVMSGKGFWFVFCELVLKKLRNGVEVFYVNLRDL